MLGCFAFWYHFSFFALGPVLFFFTPSCHKDLTSVTFDCREHFWQLSFPIQGSMEILVVPQKFTSFIPRLPKLLFWINASLNWAQLFFEPARQNDEQRLSLFKEDARQLLHPQALVHRVRILLCSQSLWSQWRRQSRCLQMFKKFWKASFTCFCVWQVLSVIVFYSTRNMTG